MQEYNLKEWKERFNNGEFDDKSRKVQILAGWYDWFCKDTSLAGKTKRMGGIIKKLEDSEKIYVWFKNNCPIFGPLYDDFRLADIETGDTLYTIKIGDTRDDFKYVIWGIDNDFEEPLLSTDERKEVIEFLNNKIKEINKGE